MKRLTFLIAALCMLQVNVNAQTLEEIITTENSLGFIPKEFTKKQKAMLFTLTEEGNYLFLNDDLSTGKELQIIENRLTATYLYNFDEEGSSVKVYFTQTFFNDDDKLEYIRYTDLNNDDKIEHRYADLGEYNYRFEVVNEDNEVLFTINGDWIYLMHYNDRCYLRVEYYDKVVYYAINKNGSGSSISKVRTLPGLSASPAFANRNSVVDVTIDEAAAANGGELVIVDNCGRIVAKQRFDAGQTTVPVQTDRMRTGVYNITLNNGAEIDNARIIVK